MDTTTTHFRRNHAHILYKFNIFFEVNIIIDNFL